MIAYLLVALIIMATLATLSSYVIHNIQMSSRRQDMANAYQFAQGGTALACRDVEMAFTNTGAFHSNLMLRTAAPYTNNRALSTPTITVYQRSITSPFTNQTVALQVWVTNSVSPTRVKVVATTKVGNVTQSVEARLETKFAYPAAIISTHEGNSARSASKGTAQQGNVSVDGGGGTSKIDGGIIANGNINISKAAVEHVSEQLFNTSDQIPDYTHPGSDQQLFDFGRFTAAAIATGNRFTNLVHFTTFASTQTLEGIIVVDIPRDDIKKLDAHMFPNGINVRGTLCFKFAPGWGPLDKVVNEAAMNINAADLRHLIPSEPSTYTTGYPPLYQNPAKNPVGKNLEYLGTKYAPFNAEDDLPALMYNTALLDIHGPANICGVVYSPCFMEIENKKGPTQYFRGSIIGGSGILIENESGRNSIVSYDAAALDFLATLNGRGKNVKLVYQK